MTVAYNVSTISRVPLHTRFAESNCEGTCLIVARGKRRCVGLFQPLYAAQPHRRTRDCAVPNRGPCPSSQHLEAPAANNVSSPKPRFHSFGIGLIFLLQ